MRHDKKCGKKLSSVVLVSRIEMWRYLLLSGIQLFFFFWFFGVEFAGKQNKEQHTFEITEIQCESEQCIGWRQIHIEHKTILKSILGVLFGLSLTNSQ